LQDQLGFAGYPEEDNHVLCVGTPRYRLENSKKFKNPKTLSGNFLCNRLKILI